MKTFCMLGFMFFYKRGPLKLWRLYPAHLGFYTIGEQKVGITGRIKHWCFGVIDIERHTQAWIECHSQEIENL